MDGGVTTVVVACTGGVTRALLFVVATPFVEEGGAGSAERGGGETTGVVAGGLTELRCAPAVTGDGCRRGDKTGGGDAAGFEVAIERGLDLAGCSAAVLRGTRRVVALIISNDGLGG